MQIKINAIFMPTFTKQIAVFSVCSQGIEIAIWF